MFEKLIEIVLGAKSAAVSGVLIVAGAVVSVSSGNGVTTITIQDPSPTPAVEVAAEPSPSPLIDGETTEHKDKDGERDKERKEKEKEHKNAPTPESCADEAKARADALKTVHDGFTKFHTQIEHLRAERKGERAQETLKKADALIREIAEKAERVLHEMGRCHDKDGDDEDEDEDEDEDNDGEEGTAGAASFNEADAVTMRQVAERAVAAMETVYNLAKSAAEATPKPTEKPKATEKPRQAEKAKPSRTPSCDDKIYAAKKVLVAAFERFHSQNDLLWKLAEKLENEKVFEVVKASDKTMHSAYESTKEAIFKAGCAENVGMGLATKAADIFERAFNESKGAFATANGSSR